MNFSRRSYQKELLDGDDIPFEDIKRNMQELDLINTYLGGHAITVAGVRKVVEAAAVKKEWVICEIGCGGGDNLMAVNNWCRKKKISARFIGIDINPECIEVAAGRLGRLSCELISSDYKLAALTTSKPDIIFSSLFCHHFTDEELVYMLQWMRTNAASGFFINDLQRHPLAYYSIQILTKIFSSSYLVKNDAPLSVQRGFKKDEWEILLRAAGIPAYTVQWKWAFRYLITVSTASK